MNNKLTKNKIEYHLFNCGENRGESTPYDYNPISPLFYNPKRKVLTTSPLFHFSWARMGENSLDLTLFFYPPSAFIGIPGLNDKLCLSTYKTPPGIPLINEIKLVGKRK